MKKVLFLVIAISYFLSHSPCHAETNKKFVMGINCGYSYFLEREHYESHRYNEDFKWENKLKYHVGLKLQYYFSSHLGVQIETDYQRKTNINEYKDYSHPEYNYYYTDDFSFFVTYLNFIYQVKDFKKNNFSTFLIAGIGVKDINPFTLYSKIGGGVRYPLSSQIALNLGISFLPGPLVYKEHYLIKFFPFFIKYFSLSIGLEYSL